MSKLYINPTLNITTPQLAPDPFNGVFNPSDAMLATAGWLLATDPAPLADGYTRQWASPAWADAGNGTATAQYTDVLTATLQAQQAAAAVAEQDQAASIAAQEQTAFQNSLAAGQVPFCVSKVLFEMALNAAGTLMQFRTFLTSNQVYLLLWTDAVTIDVLNPTVQGIINDPAFIACLPPGYGNVYTFLYQFKSTIE
jgi:hypothetical protein